MARSDGFGPFLNQIDRVDVGAEKFPMIERTKERTKQTKVFQKEIRKFFERKIRKSTGKE